MTYLVLGLVAALALSAGANTVLWSMYTSAKESVGVARAERDQARSDAKACSAAVARMRKDADARKRTADAAVIKVAQEGAKRVTETLTAVPSNPDNLCESALAFSTVKLAERRRPRVFDPSEISPVDDSAAIAYSEEMLERRRFRRAQAQVPAP